MSASMRSIASSPTQILPLAGGKVVDAANLFAARKQLRGDRPANKAGCAGHQISVHLDLSHSDSFFASLWRSSLEKSLHGWEQSGKRCNEQVRIKQ